MPEQPHRLTKLDYEDLENELISIQYMLFGILTPENVSTLVAINSKLKVIHEKAFAANYWPNPPTP